MKRILVTGAAGYVGGAVVRRLLQDSDARVIGLDACTMPHGAEGVREVLDHERFSFIRADIRDEDALRAASEADAVVHLAAIVGDPAGRRDPDLTVSVNLDAAKNVAAAATEGRTEHFVFVSTCSNYGVSDPSTLADEDGSLNPLSLYAETKVGMERFLAESDVPFTCLRLATVYGIAPRMRFDLTVNQFTFEALLDGELTIFGEKFWRPYVHVQDVAKAIETVLDRRDDSLRRTFNVGHTSENYTKEMMYTLLKSRLPDLDVKWVAVDKDPRSYKVSFERIRETLGFEPEWTVPEGMDQILRHLRAGAYPDPREERFRN